MKLVIVLAFLIALHSCAKLSREVIPQKYENCDIDNLPMKVFINPVAGQDKVKFSGYFTVSEDITGEIDATVDSNKCELDMKSCFKYNSFKVPAICGALTSKSGIFADVLKSIKPPFKCPVKAGNYTIAEANFDITVFSMLPIDGAVWVANFRFVGGGAKSKKTLMCWNTETKIVKTRSKSKP